VFINVNQGDWDQLLLDVLCWSDNYKCKTLFISGEKYELLNNSLRNFLQPPVNSSLHCAGIIFKILSMTSLSLYSYLSGIE
jgi:hypothetical protein